MIIKLSLPLIATFSPVARKTTSALDPATRAIRDGAGVLEGSVATVRGRVKKTDMGALKNGQRRLQLTQTLFVDSDLWEHECPDEDFVLYWLGTGYSSAGVNVSGTEFGCDGKCCVGNQACLDFAGCVKRDGSCVGDFACQDAYAPSGIEASCKGEMSCIGLFYGTYADAPNGKVSNSCNAYEACDYLGAMGEEGHSFGTVDSSCNARGACSSLGYHGVIKSITGSCNSEKHLPCLQLAGDNFEGMSPIGDITHFKRDWRAEKTSAKDIKACIDLCEERRADSRDDCSGIKWRQGVQKPCRIFKGGFSEGKCHDKDLCITV